MRRPWRSRLRTEFREPPEAHAATGLIGASVLLRPDTKAAKNYLLKPVWLRLDLSVDRWTPYTSLDGKAWTPATTAVGVQFIGTWIGLFAASNNAGHYVEAVFDNVTGFQPDTLVRIGTA